MTNDSLKTRREYEMKRTVGGRDVWERVWVTGRDKSLAGYVRYREGGRDGRLARVIVHISALRAVGGAK